MLLDDGSQNVNNIFTATPFPNLSSTEWRRASEHLTPASVAPPTQQDKCPCISSSSVQTDSMLDIWRVTRERIWRQDQGRCQGPYCRERSPWSLSLDIAHIDHIQEISRGGSNRDQNLRTLCRRCHCLRANHTHQGMISAALRDEVIPVNWREWVWE